MVLAYIRLLFAPAILIRTEGVVKELAVRRVRFQATIPTSCWPIIQDSSRIGFLPVCCI